MAWNQAKLRVQKTAKLCVQNLCEKTSVQAKNVRVCILEEMSQKHSVHTCATELRVYRAATQS